MKQITIILACVFIAMLYGCNNGQKQDTQNNTTVQTTNENEDTAPTLEPITIYVANIGNLDRGELAEKIEILQKFNPKAIGIDAVFKERKEKAKDEKLKSALNLRKNIVLGSFVEFKRNGKASGITTTNQYFGDLPYGFCALTIDENKEAESIDKQVNINQKDVYPLSIEVIRIFNPDAFEYYKSNIYNTYIFKYSENIKQENIIIEEIDFEEITDTSSSLNRIKDGIVLLGYLGTDQISRQVNDSIDNFTYTDHSGRHIVKGVKIHAYIIGKILNEYRLGK